MRTPSPRLVLVLSAALLATAALAQPYEVRDPTRPVQEEDDPRATRLQLKYPTYDGPVDPDNPYVIQVPLYPEQQRATYLSSVAGSPGIPSAAGALSPAAVSGPGAVLAAPWGSGNARSSHQDARRSLKKLIRQLD